MPKDAPSKALKHKAKQLIDAKPKAGNQIDKHRPDRMHIPSAKTF